MAAQRLSHFSPRALAVGAALVVFGVALCAIAYALEYRSAIARLDNRAEATALSRVQALESVLATQRAVAAVLSDDAMVVGALEAPLPALTDGVSQKLDRLRAETRSTVIYLLDRSGTAIAASNWDQPDSFVGERYDFRTYYSQAMTGGTALEFALGTVSNRPGLYLSHDVQQGGAVIGVVVVKMEFGAIEAAWARTEDQTEVRDAAGIVLIAGDTSQRFLPSGPDGSGVTVIQPVADTPGWTLRLTTPAGDAVIAGLIAAAAALLVQLVALAVYLRARRLRDQRHEAQATAARYSADLQREVDIRTRALTNEMAERRAAEARLARMQADLVQANKLATLGQVTAGLAHEVNQPLATIRLLAESGAALIDAAPGEARQNMDSVVHTVDRISQIMTHLRGFARKATGLQGPVVLRDAIDASIQLTASRRRGEGPRIIIAGDSGLAVRAEAVRLEQILINLIQNAQDAMVGHANPQIEIGITAGGTEVTVTIADNGPGVTPDVAAQLFTPFASTKTDGLGLGLVIARDIARDLGGALTLDPAIAGQGACFRLRLRRA
ncbi:sensor histidine kinase [Ketogulonicigenium vulgare]|uniref:histidine kinase n=1 Tax=Ketogulonicigenium vulgare (strain WSH-001) TaxID=759362 RepID=F9Y814_KETVW|nr:ATP-binding protein [Ketogulonicigenium vulgare]ADO42954.1 integral membrane sensor signal transduction histidine kinase [Ketogulonicigenium vulgare Y25]AEM41140.1 Sensor protein [Ketogulonicigenium vulgare WSH-001]ALJ81278.1 histidine kinase [Ketogulonicigenium vulgare]ANW34017.1 histidine kinase [Ketogulonicigenium vulgare]AOZ54862.1 integral membrane sensor signal transduction histidine kinase [Ketogulonicigenium vulgare]